VEDLDQEIYEAPEVAAGKEADADHYWPHYGSRSELTGKLQGIQIDGNPGDEVVCVSGGTVVWASEYGIYKKLVLVESGNGIVYGYGGNDKSIVHVGDSVTAGSVIGFLGGTEAETDAYFFVYKDGKPMDPVKAPRVF
jgi:septal ring factor EnvC (AmiA/AmiB activator)